MTPAASSPIRQVLALETNLAQVSTARRFIERIAAEAGFIRDRIFDMTLAVSEATANAIEHAGTDQRVNVTTLLYRDRLEIQVEGPGDFQPPRRAAANPHRGLGLPLMASLSDHLAFYSRPEGGTLVSLTFYLPGRVRAPEETPLPPSIRETIEENELISTITDSVPVGIYVLDSDLRYRWTNRAYQAFLDEPFRSGDITGLHVTRVVPGVEEVGALDLLRWVSETGRAVSFPSYEFEGFSRGTTHWIMQVSPLRRERTEPPYDILVVISEVTEQEQQRRKVQEKSDEQQTALAFLHIVNSCKTTEELLQLSTEFFQSRSGCEAVGIRLKSGLDYPYRETRGFPGRFVELENSLCAVDDRGEILVDGQGCPVLECMCGNVISGRFDPALPFFTSNGSFWTNSTTKLLVSTSERDRQARTRNRCNGEGYESVALIPLRAGEQAFGLLQINDSRPDRFSPEIIAFWERLAAYLGVAVSKFLADELRKASAGLAAASNRINEILSSSLEHEVILRTGLEEMNRALDTDSGGIIMKGREGWFVRYALGFDRDINGLRITEAQEQLIGSVERLREPVVVDRSTAVVGAGSEVLRQLGVDSTVMAPLVVRGEVTGALFANRRSASVVFSQPQIDFVSRTAVSLSLAIENANAFAAQQRELERFQVLSEIAMVVSSSLDAQQVADAVLEKMVSRLAPRLASFYYLDEQARVLRHLAYRGYSEDVAPLFEDIPLDDTSNLGFAVSRELPFLTYQEAPNPQKSGERGAAVGIEQDRWVMLPLSIEGRVLGAMILSFPGRRPFEEEEMSLFRAIASQVSVAVQNARLYAGQRSIALHLQEALLTVPADVRNVEIGHLYRSATEQALVGGDFYDIFEVGGNRIAVLIGDVAGHGVEAARVATLVKDSVHAFTHHFRASPRVVLAGINRLLVEKKLYGFVTVFLGFLEPDTGRLTYSSAGHPGPFLLSPDREPRVLEWPAVPLGVFWDAVFEDREVALPDNGLVVLYTDGLTEARRRGAMFGSERLLRSLRRRVAMKVGEIPGSVFDEVLDYSEGLLADDAAMLVMKYHRPARRQRDE